MTCKSSFSKSILETMKHHLAVIITTCITFFIQLILFFLNVQNSASHLSYRIESLTYMTLPGAGYAIPVVFVAVILAYDFFRYLHSKRQTDFYDSLPVKRKDWFRVRFTSSVLIFLVPYIICTILEMLLLVVFGAARSVFFTNLLWTLLCMILVFLMTWTTAALAMILTGHSVVAIFAFGVFCGYMPVLIRYLFPAFAEQYLTTYSAQNDMFYQCNYFSPIGAAVELCGGSKWIASERTESLIIIPILIVVLLLLTYVLYLKRPSEAAGRAMAFEKANPFIRIALVIPLSLYVGLLLSLFTSVASKVWMTFGIAFGTILLHGIIESMFQFDIRGMWSKKKQMVLCFVIAIGFAFVFWHDLLGYNSYLPDVDDLASISIRTSETYYEMDDTTGVTGENMETALQLAQNIIDQDVNNEDGKEWIRYKYNLKNGHSIYRDYYMDAERNASLIDSIYASKEYKKDICELYSEDYSRVEYIKWQNSVTDIILYMSPEEMETLFDTYLTEYTPLTYTQVRQIAPIGEFVVCHESEDDYVYSYGCYVYPEFTQTIALIENFMSTQDSTKNYGDLAESILYKYNITSLEIYTDDDFIYIQDAETLESVKDYLILADYTYRSNQAEDWELYYDGSVALQTPEGIGYCSILISKEVAETLR